MCYITSWKPSPDTRIPDERILSMKRAEAERKDSERAKVWRDYARPDEDFVISLDYDGSGVICTRVSAENLRYVKAAPIKESKNK